MIKNQRHRPIIRTDFAVLYTYSGPSGELKMKIGKQVKSNFSNSMTGPSGSNGESSSRKRDRSSPQSSELVPPVGPPAKAARFSTSSGEQHQSGNTCSVGGKQLFSHKDKDKDRHKGEKAESSAPIKITIPKDKISLGSTLKPVAGTGPVIKVHRRRPIICTDSAGMYTYAGPSRELIVKSLKEIKSNFSNSMTGPSGSNSETPSSSRKRDRSSPQSSELVPPLGPPAKAARFSTS